MQRVRMIRTLRAIFSSHNVSIVVGVVAVLGIAREVFVAKVFENMPALTDVVAQATFWTSAYMHTTVAVQLFLVAAIAATLYGAYATAKILSPVRVMA